MDNNFAFSFDLPFKKKCSLPDCNKLGNHVSRVTLDGNVLDFCCPQHALVGKKRWEEKKELNIRPSEPKKKPIGEEMIGASDLEGSE